MGYKIYRPAKTAMQSGRGGERQWVLEYLPQKPGGRDPLMGWSSSLETEKQVKLTFARIEDAIAYAQKAGVRYRMIPSAERKFHKKIYSDCFS